MPPPTMVDTTAVDTDMDMVLDTEDTMGDTTAILMVVTVMPTTTARGPLMPNPRLKPKPIPHTCMLVPMATPMPMVILMDMDTELSPLTTPPALATNMFPPLLPPMVSLNSTKDPLMPNPRLMLMPPLMLTTDTTAVDTDTDMDTVMAVTTVMADTDLDTDMVDTAVTTVRFHG